MANLAPGWHVAWIKAVAKAWADPTGDLEKKLKHDPAAALGDHGYVVPKGVTLRVVEHDAVKAPTHEIVLYLPPKPGPEDQATRLAELLDVSQHHCCGQPCI